jgi:hypothetical protein
MSLSGERVTPRSTRARLAHDLLRPRQHRLQGLDDPRDSAPLALAEPVTLLPRDLDRPPGLAHPPARHTQ